MKRAVAFAAASAFFVALPGARADADSTEKAQARLLLQQGNQLFERGDLRSALVDFRAAYALFASPKLLVNMAAAERELGDLAGAANDLRHFLDDAREEDQSLVEKARGDLLTLEKRVGRVALLGWPARTTLAIDGRVARDPTYVKPGAHLVKARAPSGVEAQKEVQLIAGESAVLEMPRGAVVGNDAAIERSAPPQRRARWVVPVAVVGALLVAGGVVAGVVLGVQAAQKPLSGDLGTYTFSQFH